jgi:hypothetical protein
MAKRNILKEAIADAKAVREVALVNAKAALEEAFTPKLQNMLSARLSEDLDEDYYEDGDDELELGEMMYDEDEKSVDEMMYDEDETSMDEEIDLEEILNELELEEGDDAEKVEGKKKGDFLKKMTKPSPTIPPPDDDMHLEEGDEEDDDKEKVDETFDLDALLEEINSLDKKVLPKRISKRTPTVTPRNVKSRKPIGTLREGTCRDTKLQVQNLKNELFVSNKALKTLKGELNEVNLLNSKLLYVNTRKPIKENLGMASKAAGISRTKKLAPKRAVINESDNMISRFQKLANIKINE